MNKKYLWICWYIFVIIIYSKINAAPIINIIFGKQVAINYFFCISEMYGFSARVGEGPNKRFKPGHFYFGPADREILNIYQTSDRDYVDPFIKGPYSDTQLIHYPKGDRRIQYFERKGALLKYYTDGHSSAVIISAGPDGIYEDFNPEKPESVYDVRLYDPNNGLYSSGDIVMCIGIKNIYKMVLYDPTNGIDSEKSHREPDENKFHYPAIYGNYKFDFKFWEEEKNDKKRRYNSKR
jgi:hypothetical protein